MSELTPELTEKGKATMRNVSPAPVGGTTSSGGGIDPAELAAALAPFGAKITAGMKAAAEREERMLEALGVRQVVALDPEAAKMLTDGFATFSELCARQAMRLEAALAHMGDLYQKERVLNVTAPAQPSPIVNVQAIPPAISFKHESAGIGVRALAILVAGEMLAAAAIAVPLWLWYFQGKI